MQTMKPTISSNPGIRSPSYLRGVARYVHRRTKALGDALMRLLTFFLALFPSAKKVQRRRSAAARATVTDYYLHYWKSMQVLTDETKSRLRREFVRSQYTAEQLELGWN